MLELGASRPSPDALPAFAGSPEIGGAMVEYFAPLKIGERVMHAKAVVLAVTLAMMPTGLALAQSGSSGGKTARQMVGAGGIAARSGAVTMTLRYLGEGRTEAEAQRAVQAKLERLLQVLEAEGIPNAALRDQTPQEVEVMLAGVIETVEAEEVESSAAEATRPNFVLSGIKKLSVASVEQADSLRAKLADVDVKVDDVRVESSAEGAPVR